MILLQAAGFLVAIFPFTLLAWLILDSKTGAKSAGPPPRIPPGLDLGAFVAKVNGVESERRGRG